MKNILIIMPNDSLGGAEQYLKMLVVFFKNENIEVVFLKKRDGSQWEDIQKSISIDYVSTKNEKIGLLLFFVRSLFRKKSTYDYIFTSHVYTNALIGLLISLKRIQTKKFVARESTSIFLRYSGFALWTYKLAYHIGYFNIDLLICQTSIMKNQLLKSFSKLTNRTEIEVINNPINLSLIQEKSKEVPNIQLPKQYIISAGRLIPEKGYDILIKALSRIKKKHPDLKLIILGEGNERKKLENLITTLELTNDVILMGYVNNVYGFFKKAKLGVVSSRIEGFPNVLLQMMSQCNRIVSTECAGGIDKIPNIITAKTDDVDSLYSAILKSLDNENSDKNRFAFDQYLAKRDIDNFISQIV
ncbi:glycosyltransferase [Aquimarina sp. RZ0]|uniref:glycosyltransferase n=1 Tax=Aquimarina sp. RZ0 TaxID=2607730 RepID=UPI0011F396F7|nr:glycosyltransferase [Aquimarina sp. RZ0]KAA1246945.1 glycosyltransferase [Aquimarina sp. RZ0]